MEFSGIQLEDRLIQDLQLRKPWIGLVPGMYVCMYVWGWCPARSNPQCDLLWPIIYLCARPRARTCIISCVIWIFQSNTQLRIPSSSLFQGAAAGAAAFLCVLLGKNPPGAVTINRGKLLQHKLIDVQCTKKKYPSTGIPCTRRF